MNIIKLLQKQNPIIVYILIIKDLYEFIELIDKLIFKKEINMNLPEFYIDFIIQFIIVTIIYVLLKQIKKYIKYLNDFKTVTSHVNIVRAEYIYLSNKKFVNDKTKINHFRSNLANEYDQVKERLQEENNELSPKQITLLLEDYYGYKRELLNQRENEHN